MPDLDFNALAAMSEKQLQDIFGIRDIFSYDLSMSGIAAAGTAQASFTVQSDSNFLWQAGMMTVDTTGTYAANPQLTGIITDQGSGRQLMSAASPLANWFGDGKLPFLLPTPRFFRAQTQVNVAITNYSSGTTYTNVKLTFMGTKFFKFAQSL